MSKGRSGLPFRPLRALFHEGAVGGLTDAELLRRFVVGGGDDGESAFAALMERHGPMVLRVCGRVLRDPQDVEDAFQATFLVLLRKAGRLDVGDSLGPWLHGVAFRAAASVRSTSGRRRAHERRAAGMRAESIVTDVPDDTGAALHEEIRRLPERFRAPIVLCCLEGLTQQQAARSLGWPLGTVQSRLARGRDRLRDRLGRRGLAPSAVWIGLAPGERPIVPIGTAGTILRLSAAGRGIAGVVPANAVRLADEVTRSLIMTKLKWTTAALLIASGIALGGARGLQPTTSAARPPAVVQERAGGALQGAGEDDPANAPERRKNYLIATIGNSLSAGPGRIVNREAILYQDGTVRLWTFDSRTPVAGPLRHEGPIRNLAFFDRANLLATTSDHSMRLWDAATGAPRGEIEGPRNPLLHHSYSSTAGRFVTIDPDRRVVSIRDASNFRPIATCRSEAAPLLAAALSEDGRTLATFGEGRTVELCDLATSRVFATLRPPSVVAEVFGRDDRTIDQSKLERLGGPFWEVVRSLAPRIPDRAEGR